MKDEKVKIPESLLKVVDEEQLDKILKRTEKSKKYRGVVNYDIPKEVLNMMRGKSLIDVSHTILTLAQIIPTKTLYTLYKTLDIMLRLRELNKLKKSITSKLDTETILKEYE